MTSQWFRLLHLRDTLEQLLGVFRGWNREVRTELEATMAANTADLTRFLSENAPQGAFQPCAHYDWEADAFTFYFSNEPDYRKWLNARVTLYLSMEMDELVGVRIKNVRSVLEDIGSLDVDISHGKVRLKVLFAALHSAFAEDPNSRSVYRQLGNVVRENDLELDLAI